jgi:hypothetical protein
VARRVLDSDGAGYITIFAGQQAEARARDYHDAIAEGRLETRIAESPARWKRARAPKAECSRFSKRKESRCSLAGVVGALRCFLFVGRFLPRRRHLRDKKQRLFPASGAALAYVGLFPVKRREPDVGPAH